MKIPHSSIWIGVVAIFSGALAFYAAQRYLADTSAEVERVWQARYAPRPVLVAARDLEPGRPLGVSDLAKRAMPAAFVPGGAIDPERLQEVVGKPLLLPLRAGDPIVDSQVATRNETALAARLREGARAVTVPVDEVSSQAGLVRPGDRVDLMLAEEVVAGTDRCVRVRPLLEALAVLATGQVQSDSTRGAEAMLRRGVDVASYSTITLDVTPEQAQQLALALRMGELIPLLRGDADQLPIQLAERTAGQPACLPAAGPATAAKRTGGTRLHDIELLVGGDAAAQRSRLRVPLVVNRGRGRQS
ncbi:MAG: Flp pilus assembly protein CpaB [Gammaproteobacteria bacterium]|nr:Flp pilus assembly protein CpaB [Gammaproteobacteria bacterium]